MPKPLNVSNPMSPDDVFQTTLICLAEVSHNILKDRCNPKTHQKRLYWLERMKTAIDALQLTYDGYLPDNFIDRGEKFMKWIEVDMNSLLKDYKEGK